MAGRASDQGLRKMQEDKEGGGDDRKDREEAAFMELYQIFYCIAGAPGKGKAAGGRCLYSYEERGIGTGSCQALYGRNCRAA